MKWFICTRCGCHYRSYQQAENCCPPVEIWDDDRDDDVRDVSYRDTDEVEEPECQPSS